MSGIAGIVSLSRERPEPAAVERMLATLGHRGGEAPGVFSSARGRLVLGCRASSANGGTAQPLGTPGGELWLAADAALYNRGPLRHEFELEDRRFRCDDDAGAILHALRRHGLDALPKLHGMFALALWDERSGRLILARDRLGKKPLYHARLHGLLAFASEPAALFAALPLARRLDAAALDQYLTYGFVTAPLTMLAEVRKLGPGEALVVERTGALRYLTWWTPGADGRKATANAELPMATHVSNVRTLIESAVADRLAGTAPQAVLLDGSAESAAVAAMASRLLGRPLATVAVATATDGAAPAQAVARRLGLPCHVVAVPENRGIERLGEHLYHLDDLVADAACLDTWWTSQRLADEGIRLALAGDGAEAVLLHHPAYAIFRRLAPLWRLPPRLRASACAAAAGLMRGEAAAAIRRWQAGAPPFLTAQPLFDGPVRRALLAAQEPAQAPGWPAHMVAARVARELPDGLAGDPLTMAGYCDLRMRVAELSLSRLDRMSAAHAIEIRLPFLDHQLVDYLLAIPGLRRMHLLRRIVGGLLPDDVVAATATIRPPAQRWFGAAAARRLDERLRAGRLFADGIIAAQPCRRLLAGHRGGAGDAARLWALLALAEWYEVLGVDGVAPTAPAGLPLRAGADGR